MQDCGVLAAGVHVRNGYQEREERLDEKNKKIISIICSGVLHRINGLSDIGGREPDVTVTPEQNPAAGDVAQDESVSDGVSTPATEPEETITPDENPSDGEVPPPAGEQSAVLYIGTVTDGFTEYPMTYEGELTPELLIQGMEELTGWDLTLAEEVTTGKGGMSVCLSDECALFTGPPDPQKEEFHMFDVGQLARTILDSIQKTQQMGFTGAGGDPDALDIYYYMEGERPLEVPALGISWPLDQPYQWPET